MSRLRHRLSFAWNEHRLGIRTEEEVRLEDLGIRDERYLPYTPTSFRDFHEIMRRLGVREGEDVLLDLGSGKGGVLVMAATHPFRRVIGVEISAELNRLAHENLRNARRRLRCQDVEIVTADAMEYAIPRDVSIFYFYSPFRGEVLRRVLDAIRASVVAHPRRARVVFKNTLYFDREIGPCEWLVETQRFASGGHPCAILEVQP